MIQGEVIGTYIQTDRQGEVIGTYIQTDRQGEVIGTYTDRQTDMSVTYGGLITLTPSNSSTASGCTLC